MSCEFQIRELRGQIYELRVQIHRLQVQIHKLQVQIYELGAVNNNISSLLVALGH